MFVSSPKDFPSRLRDILKKKGASLFRWIEIQLEIFRVRYFRTIHEIEQQLEWLQTHTTHNILNDEYTRLFALLKEHPPNEELALGTLQNDKLALKMLKLIACSEYDLRAEDLAEAITASNPANDVVEFTPDDVRRILVGFISETVQTARASQRSFFNINVPIVQLAHSSVLEYLTDDLNNLGFSTLAQHSEAALLSFSRISISEKRPELSSRAELSSSGRTSMKEVSNFLEYSCFVWPIHCRRAFDEDPKCSLLVQTKDFILSDGFMRWNETIRSHDLKRLDPSSLLTSPLTRPVLRWLSSLHTPWGDGVKNLEYMSFNNLSARPGFVISGYGLTELLEFPEIRLLIDLQHTNSHGMSLLVYALKIGKSSTVDRLVELYPDQVEPSKGQYTLGAAAERGYHDVVEKLLNSGDEVNARDLNNKPALYYALHWFLIHDVQSKQRRSQARVNTVQILLQKGANIFWIDDFNGWSLMHYAILVNEPALLSLFVEHAIQLEESDLLAVFRGF